MYALELAVMLGEKIKINSMVVLSYLNIYLDIIKVSLNWYQMKQWLIGILNDLDKHDKHSLSIISLQRVNLR